MHTFTIKMGKKRYSSDDSSSESSSDSSSESSDTTKKISSKERKRRPAPRADSDIIMRDADSDITVKDARERKRSAKRDHRKSKRRSSPRSKHQPISDDIFYTSAFRKYRVAAKKHGSTPQKFLNCHKELMNATNLLDNDAWDLYKKEAFSLDAAYRACNQRTSITARTVVEHLHTFAQTCKIQDYEQLTFGAAEQLVRKTFMETNWVECRSLQTLKAEVIRRLLKISNEAVINSALLLANGKTVTAIQFLQNMVRQFQKSHNIEASLAHNYLNRFFFDADAARNQYQSDLVSHFTKKFGVSELKAIRFLEHAKWNLEEAERQFRVILLDGLTRKSKINSGSQFHRLRQLLAESKFNIPEYKKLLARDIAADSGWGIKATTALIERHDFDIPAIYAEYTSTPITAEYLVD
jgi:hypothetical protein